MSPPGATGRMRALFVRAVLVFGFAAPLFVGDVNAQTDPSSGAPVAAAERSAMTHEDAYRRKLFWVAARDGPSEFPLLQNVEGPNLVTAGMRRVKSGTPGLGRLEIEKWFVAEGVLAKRGVNRWSLRVEDVQLRSGALAPNATVGTYPLVPQPYLLTPVPEQEVGLETYVRFDRDGEIAPYVELGTTPRDGALASELVARIGFTEQTAHGFWRPEVFSRAVRESLLSYTGMVDPYTGAVWGRVRRDGLGVLGYQQLNADWGVYADASVADYSGTGVMKNRGMSLGVSLGRSINAERFDYFSIGPSLLYMAFADNLSHFTLGHGGYFSPQSYSQLGVSASFMTREAQAYLIRGNINVGFERFREEASPIFPLAPDGRFHSANKDTNVGVNAELLGVRRIGAHWQVGGALLLRNNPSYHDRFGLIFVRWLMDPRPAVFSIDLPVNLFRDLE